MCALLFFHGIYITCGVYRFIRYGQLIARDQQAQYPWFDYTAGALIACFGAEGPSISGFTQLSARGCFSTSVASFALEEEGVLMSGDLTCIGICLY